MLKLVGKFSNFLPSNYDGKEGTSDNTWLIDSGASNHMTRDTDSLSDVQDYPGMNKIMIGKD